MEKFLIRYHEEKYGDLKRIEQTDVGDWIDLRAAADVELSREEYVQIPLGISAKIPDGYEVHIAPRSGAFKRYGILQTNGVGVVDHTYCGDDDEWKMPVYATRRAKIEKNTRICQFRLVPVMPKLDICEVDYLDGACRGGFGSTGQK